MATIIHFYDKTMIFHANYNEVSVQLMYMYLQQNKMKVCQSDWDPYTRNVKTPFGSVTCKMYSSAYITNHCVIEHKSVIYYLMCIITDN